MPQKSNDLKSFWQELIRRKVFRVTAMYSGTAFIILQLVDIIAQPLQLPPWTITLVIVLLCIGLLITLLIAWIYDITPDGIRRTEPIETVKKRKSQTVPAKRELKTSDIIIVLMAIVIVILLYPKIFNKDKLKDIKGADGRISVAVMPFQNMTNDTLWNVWQDGIQNELIASMTNSEYLKVRQIESITSLLQSKGLTNYASVTPSVAGAISQKLDANIFIYGTIKQADSAIRLNAQLIDSETEESFKSFQINGTSGNILRMIDSLSNVIKNFLIISSIGKGVPSGLIAPNLTSTNSPEAYRYLIYGQKAFYKMDFPSAINWYLKALERDSNLTGAIQKISNAYYNQGMYKEAKKWCLKHFKKLELMTPQQQLWANYYYAWYFNTLNDAVKYMKQLKDIDDQQPLIYFGLGDTYLEMYQYDNAILEFEKALKLYERWGIKPLWSANYEELGEAYHETGQYKKEKELYKKAKRDFPDDPLLITRQAILAFTEGDSVAAGRYLEKSMSIRKEQGLSEANISGEIAQFYLSIAVPEKAERYFRQAYSLESENPLWMNNLAYFLIDNDRNIIEGLELINRALASSPGDYNYLHTKGWGLYKQEKYKDALEYLQKSWDERPVYDHKIYLHLEEARKAVESQKNN